ncbi:MAG: hypothetical protein ABSG53_20985 [Thermoguttaceae bacterium]
MSLLRISEGRPTFRCQVQEIAATLRQHPRTVEKALRELTFDGWIDCEIWKPLGSAINASNRYTLLHLLPR